MDDADFALLAQRLAERIGSQQFTDQLFARAISYPWHTSPAEGGFLISGDRVTEIDSSSEASSLADAARVGLVAIGSNADPATLVAKLSSLPDPDDRVVAGIHGRLLDFEIGHSPHLAVYGSLPATLYHRAGGSTTATLLMVTPAQLTALSKTEFNYLLAQLPGNRFTAASEQVDLPAIFGFVSRHGVVVDRTGEPTALHRPHQRALLDTAAQAIIEPNAKASDLVRRTLESYAWAVGDARPRLAALARPLDRGEWELHPGR